MLVKASTNSANNRPEPCQRVVGLPEDDTDLIENYQSYSSSKEITEEEQKRLNLIDEQIARAGREIEYKMDLDEFRIKFIESGDFSGRLKNWQMAEADFCINWLSHKKQQLEQEMDRDIQWLKYKYANKLKQFEDKIVAAQKYYDLAYQQWLSENWQSQNAYADNLLHPIAQLSK